VNINVIYPKNKQTDLRDKCKLIPVTFAFTDEYGQFLFGVTSEADFVIKLLKHED